MRKQPILALISCKTYFSQLCSLTDSKSKQCWDRPTQYPRRLFARGGYWTVESSDQCCVVHQHQRQSLSFFFSACVFSSSSRQWRAVRSRLPDWKLWVRDHVAFLSVSVCWCLCLCVWTSVVFFFFFHLSRLVCLYSGRVHVVVCVFPCLSVPSPLLAQVLSGELQQSRRLADRCMGGGGRLSLSLSVCLSLHSVAHVPLTTTEILLHCDLFA